MALQLRRGTNAQRLAITPLDGELIVVTDYDDVNVSALWLGDGETPGGINPISLSLDELNDVVITSPAEGQQLFYDGATWRNSNKITHTSSANRTTFQFDTSTAGVNSVLNLKRNREGSAFATGDGPGLKFQVSSNDTGTTEYAIISSSYSATQPSINFATSVDNGTNYTDVVTMGTFGLDVWKNEISLNRQQRGSPATMDAYITADRGNDPSARIRWHEASDRWQISNDGSTYITLPSQNLETTSEPTFAGVTAGVVRIGTPGINNLIDTSASDLALQAATGLIRIEGDLVVAYNVLTVKDATNRVGVNNISPSYDLDVTGVTRSSLGGLFRNLDLGVTEANTVYATGNLNLNSSSGTVIVGNDLTVTGNLTVSGNTTTVNVSDLQIEDNIILLNRNESGTGITLGSAGLEIERGTATNVSWIYDEASDWWAPGGDGNSLNIWAAGNITAGTNLNTNGTVINFNATNLGLPANCDLKVQRGALVDPATIRWNESTDRWTYSNANSSVFYNLPNQNLDTNTLVQFSGVNLDDRAVIDTVNATTTSTTEFTLDSTSRNAIKLMVYMERGTDSHSVEILIMRTSTSAMMTTYGEMYTSTPLATFTADQSAGSIRVRATPTSATSTTFSAQRCSLT